MCTLSLSDYITETSIKSFNGVQWVLEFYFLCGLAQLLHILFDGFLFVFFLDEF